MWTHHRLGLVRFAQLSVLSAQLVAFSACSGEPSSPARCPPAAPPPVASPAQTASAASVVADVAMTAAPSAAPSAAPAAPKGPPPSPDAVALREAVLKSSRAFEIVRSLVDEVGQRFSGTQGNADAVAWALRTLPALGLTKVSAEPVKVPHWERGPASAEIVAPTRRPMAMLALGGSVATPKAGLEADVIEAATMEALAAMDPSAVKGKIVFISTKMEKARDGAGYKIGSLMRRRGASLAGKLGAVGLLIRSAGTDDDRLPHTGALGYDPKLPKIPAAALSVPDAELLHRLIASGKPTRVRMAISAKTLPDVASSNIIADVPGSVAPDEIVLLGAHLDSWDVGMGAQDDGAGCAIVIEAARQIAALPRKPRRTVRVVLFNNEENGGAGQDAYKAAHAAEFERHILAMEADLGSGRVWRARFLGGDKGRAGFAALAELLAPLGVEASTDEARGGSDIGALQEAGVPILDLFQDLTYYFDVHHTENDTLDKIRKDELDQATAAFTVAAFAAADAPDDLGRVPEEKRGSKH